MLRVVWPVLIAVAGVLPVLLERVATRHHQQFPHEQALSVIGVAVVLNIVALGIAGLVAVWIRVRDDLHRAFRVAMEGNRARTGLGARP